MLRDGVMAKEKEERLGWLTTPTVALLHKLVISRLNVHIYYMLSLFMTRMDMMICLPGFGFDKIVE